MSGARQQLIELYHAAVAGANVESLTADAVANVPLERRHRVWLFAFGKAANSMAAAAYTALKRGLAEVAGGVVVSPDKAESPAGTIAALVGDHPIPGRRSFDAAARGGAVGTAASREAPAERSGGLSARLVQGALPCADVFRFSQRFP